MIINIITWLYILNLTLLMMHETEAAYWKEWTYFGKVGKSLSDKSGLTIFTLARIPICIPLFYGLLKIQDLTGLIISLIFSSFIIFFHFPVHMLSLKKGHQEFRLPVSYFILISSFIISLIQFIITIKLLSA